MSGICGVVAPGGSGSPPGALDLMTDRLAHRGPEGTRHWTDTHAALGHALLATTPEAAVEVLPLEHAGSGCVITADARLDNRADLARDLGLDPGARLIGDGEMILMAYLRWGEDCAAHLLGDFAFAIWDPRRARLFAARDHMGTKQLIYGLSGGRLIFATHASAVRAVDPDRFPLSIPRIADFLEDLEEIDFVSTFYDGILRLPPAHVLRFDGNGLALRRYWTLEAGPELRLGSDAAYEAAFLDVFGEAVRCRLRAHGPVGSMMSGGMDSNTICAVAAEILAADGNGPLRTFSIVGPDPEICPETRAIHAAMTMSGIAPTSVDYTRWGALRPRLIQALRRMEDPFDGHLNLLRGVYALAAQSGVRVVLDGMGSDAVFLPGDLHRRFMQRGHWRRVLRDARGARLFWGEGPPPVRALILAAVRAYAPGVHRTLRSVLAPRDDVEIPPYTLVSDELAQQVDMDARRRRYARNTAPDAERVRGGHHALVHPNFAVALESYDRAAASAPVEPRDPYVDLRVIDFCLSLPAEQAQLDGWPKILLRRAMKGRIPDAILWRRGKENLSGHATDSLIGDPSAWPDLADNLAALGPAFANLAAHVDRRPGFRQNEAEGHDWDRAVMTRFLSLWVGSDR